MTIAPRADVITDRCLNFNTDIIDATWAPADGNLLSTK